MADDPYQLDGWPISSRAMGTVAQIHAIGQISLAFNYLQEAMELLFRLCMPTERDFSILLFHQLNNKDRINLLRAVVTSNENEPPVKDAILAAILHYDICTENRNIMMHAVLDIANPDGIQLSKRSSRKPLERPNTYRLPTELLRQMADEMDVSFNFILAVQRWLSQSRPDTRRPLAGPTILMGNGEPPPLPQIPPKPHRLTTFQPPASPPGGPSPPGSSPP